jgi:hypothetical protein
MTTKAICMVKGIRLQKPSPKALAVSVGAPPLMMAARLTTPSASAANTQESGNQRSENAAQRRAKRAERLSLGGGLMGYAQT